MSRLQFGQDIDLAACSVPVADLVALAKLAGITLRDGQTKVSLADSLKLDLFLLTNPELTVQKGLHNLLPLSLSAGCLPPRPPPPPPPESLADCVGVSQMLMDHWRRQYEYFADANGLLISENSEPDFSVLRIRELQSRVFDLERQAAANPEKQMAKLSEKLKKQAQSHKETVAAWRTHEQAVADVRIQESSRIARVGGCVSASILGG